MGPWSRVLEALTSGLQLALLGPPLAAAVFTLRLVIWPSSPADAPEPGVSSIPLLALGVVSAAYFLSGLPAFLAGLVLPALRQRLPLPLAAIATGLCAVAAYLATFGMHLLTQPNPLGGILPIAGPAFVGVAVAAWLISRRSRV